MASIYPPRKRAPGYARRDFTGGVYWEEQDPVTGEVKMVQVPASYWKQPEDAIPLDKLTEFWEHNNTQFTDNWRSDFNKRLCDEYLQIVCSCDPEVSIDEGATYGNLVHSKEAFFDSVSEIEQWPFWKYTVQNEYREGPLVSDVFKDACPEYDEYRAFKSTRYRSERRGLEYARWRERCFELDKSGANRFQVSGVDKYVYRDEEVQLGEIELYQDIGPSEDPRRSIYEYFAGMNLVPSVGMPDLDAIRGEVSEVAGEGVSPEKLVEVAAEYVERVRKEQQDKPAAKAQESAREIHERRMADIDRMIADLRGGSVEKSKEVYDVGW